jgi:tRNA-binding EMAP/Myf-like protein
MDNQGEITFATVKEIIGKTGKTMLYISQIDFGDSVMRLWDLIFHSSL